MKKSSPNAMYRQRGVATLAISLLILFLVTLVTLYTANTSVMEQKVSANQYRADQAFSAANAALDYAIAVYDANPDDAVSGTSGEVTGGIQYAFGGTQVAGWSIDSSAPPVLTGIGISDDKTATRTISVKVGNLDIVGNGPRLPLVSRGAVGIGGTFNIWNAWNNDNVWSGRDTSLESGALRTYVPDPDYSGDWTGIDWETKDADYDWRSELKRATVVGSDVDTGESGDIVDKDVNLKNLGTEGFWSLYFSKSRGEVQRDAANIGQSFTNASPSDLVGLKGIIWHEGDITINAQNEVGSRSDPVMLVVNGDLTLNGGAEIYGLVYVVGEVSLGAGGALVWGALAGEDDTVDSVSTSGTLDVVFDPNAARGVGPRRGETAIIPGTWKDWTN